MTQVDKIIFVTSSAMRKQMSSGTYPGESLDHTILSPIRDRTLLYRNQSTDSTDWSILIVMEFNDT